MVKNIKKNGQYVTSKKREVIEDYEDDLLVGRSEGEWVSDADSIRNKLMNVSKEAQQSKVIRTLYVHRYGFGVVLDLNKAKKNTEIAHN